MTERLTAEMAQGAAVALREWPSWADPDMPSARMHSLCKRIADAGIDYELVPVGSALADHDERIERAAVAYYEADGESWDGPEVTETYREWYRKIARIVVDAYLR